jgi:hypothetical protein
MAIPVMVAPEFVTEVPSTKQQIKFRPFLVKEEKILFMALEGGDAIEIANAVRNVLRSCILDEEFEVSGLATFDIEYLFLQLRSKSVGEVIELNLRHPENSECKHVTEYGINVDDIKVVFPQDVTNTVMVTDTVGLKLNYPSLESLKKAEKFESVSMDAVIDLIAEHVECIFDQENVFDQFTKQEVVEFIESLNSNQFKELTNFFNNAPELKHEINWTCSACNKEERIVLRGLQSFFI